MASGNTLLILHPQNNLPPSSNYATFDTRNVSNLVLEFDASTIESAFFSCVMPRAYASGGITCMLAWCADTAVTGSVVWGISIERCQDETDDLDTDSFAAEQTATSAAPTGSAGQIQYCSIAFTDGAQMDSVTAAERFRLKLRRVATDGSDDMAGDAQMVALEIRET